MGAARRKAGADDEARGLWSNIKRVQDFTHWSLSSIAKQAHYYAADVSGKTLFNSLRQLVGRRQLRWKYAGALAQAWGVGEQQLLHDDFSACATLGELERDFGFSVHDVIARYEANRQRESGTPRLPGC